jgi:hypothetical protein
MIIRGQVLLKQNLQRHKLKKKRLLASFDPWRFVPDGTKEKFDGNGSDVIGIKGHSSAPVDIDGHKSDAIDIDKDLVGDEKDIEIPAVMVWFPIKKIP